MNTCSLYVIQHLKQRVTGCFKLFVTCIRVSMTSFFDFQRHKTASPKNSRETTSRSVSSRSQAAPSVASARNEAETASRKGAAGLAAPSHRRDVPGRPVLDTCYCYRVSNFNNTASNEAEIWNNSREFTISRYQNHRIRIIRKLFLLFQHLATRFWTKYACRTLLDTCRNLFFESGIKV